LSLYAAFYERINDDDDDDDDDENVAHQNIMWLNQNCNRPCTEFSGELRHCSSDLKHSFTAEFNVFFTSDRMDKIYFRAYFWRCSSPIWSCCYLVSSAQICHIVS